MTTGELTTGEVMAAACGRIAQLGAAHYFVPETLARGKELGLDGFRFYVLGRGGVLGDVEAQVVQSAFGYFNPALITRMWDSGRARVAPREAARAHLACAHALGRARFSGVAGLEDLCAALEAIDAAADPAALALYAGISAEPRPDDPPARVVQLLAVLRELRGSAHLLAVVASGLSPKQAHYLRRPKDFGLFGWTDADIPAVTEGDAAALRAADLLTDRLLAPAFGALDANAVSALLAGLAGLEQALGDPGL